MGIYKAVKRAKDLIKRGLKRFGAEIVRLNEDEQRIAAGHTGLDYKDIQAIRAIGGGGRSIEEAIFLAELTRRAAGPAPIVEIGTLFGWSTHIIVLNKLRGQKLYTVDNYSWNPLGISPDAHHLATQRALADAVAHHNVVQVKADKNSFYENYSGEPPALVFLDANHSYEETKADIQWALKVRTRIICGDDYHPERFPGVTRAVKELNGPKELVGRLFVL